MKTSSSTCSGNANAILSFPSSPNSMFWRDAPAKGLGSGNSNSGATKPDWPRNGALLKGIVHDISPEKVEDNHLWLEVQEYQQAGTWVAR